MAGKWYGMGWCIAGCLGLLLILPATLIGLDSSSAAASEVDDQPRFTAQNVYSGNVSDQFTNKFAVPRGAWQRIAGDVPWPTVSSDPNRGVVLGGFGAGAFMYNLSGSFGPWADEVGEYSSNRLSGAAFHIYERIGEEVTIRCLSTDTMMLPAWECMEVGDGTYYALQPKGWCDYNCFSTDVRSTFFSPIIAHNYRETSFPVAVWQFALANPTADTSHISIMLTWPHPPFNGGRRLRTGYMNTLNVAPGKFGIVLKADDPANAPETQNSEWCIATRQDDDVLVTYTTWNAEGDGSDVWNNFTFGGILPNSVNPFASAAALAVKVAVPPGQTKVVPIVVAWDFPVVEFDSDYGGGRSTQWWKRYCEYFDTLSDNSFAVASEALDSCDSWSDRIDEWTSPYVTDPRYPDWLICAAFNELYYNQMGGSFWESGLRSGHPEEFLGLHPGDHKNFIMESQAYTLSGNISVGHYSSIVYASFWPEMEHDLLWCHADIVLYWDECDPVAPYQTAPEIGAPRDFSSFDSCTLGDPFFAVDPHKYQTRSLPCEPGVIHLQTETSSKYIQRCWRYYALYEDIIFLSYVWPSIKRTYEFMKTYDCEAEPRDSLPDAQGYDNTYDGWAMYGTDIYSGGFWIGALEAMDTMAAILGDPIRGEVQSWLAAARRNLDEQLWDNQELYYHLDTDSDYPEAVFADALAGQRFNEAWGLPDILPRWKMDAHLQKVYDICVVPNQLYGARLGRLPDGSIVPTGDRDTFEYWVGTTYYLAAMMYHAGLKDEALNTAYGAFYPVFEDNLLAYWFNTPEAWQDNGDSPRPTGFSLAKKVGYAPGETPVDMSRYPAWGTAPHQYQRPRAIWELIFEMSQSAPEIPIQLLPEDFAYLNDNTPVFHWSKIVGTDGSYTIQWAKDEEFSIELHTIMELSDTSIVIPDSLSLTDALWFWRIQAVGAAGHQSGYQDEPFSFVVDADIPCDCTYLGDCNADQAIDPVDVAYLVTYVYKGYIDPPPPIPDCPAVNGDWDCDDALTPLDVSLMVTFVYRNPDPGPCAPCD
ncbi:GH116 family glycosyl hydrolase [Candidatus Zixiibacteriota bacterium]